MERPGMFILKFIETLPCNRELFCSYAVNGSVVEISVYENSDLVSSRDFTLREARNHWANLRKQGWVRDQ